MNEHPFLEITEHELPFGKSYRTYHWPAKPWQAVLIGDRAIEYRHEMPWKLVEVERYPEWRGSLYVRSDGFLLVTRCLMAVKIKVKKLLELVYYRLILTAMVWGLAYVPDFEAPSWRHLGKQRKW